MARREQWIGGGREGCLGGQEQMADPGEPCSCGLVSNKGSKLSLKILHSIHICVVFMSYNYSYSIHIFIVFTSYNYSLICKYT